MKDKILKKERYAYFRIEKDSEDLFVLRANTFGAIVGTAVLLPIGVVFFWAAYYGGRKHTALLFISGIFGLLFFAGGVATLRRALFNRDRIVFDRSRGEVRLEFRKASKNTSIPYSSLEKVTMQISRSGSSNGGSSLMYQVDLVDKDGKTTKINKSGLVDDMLRLGSHVARLCGVPFAPGR